MTYNISNFVFFISFQKCLVNPGETTRLFILKPSNPAFWLSFETYLHCCCALIPNIWCDFMLQYFVQNTTGRQYIYSILRPYTMWIKTKGKIQIVERRKKRKYIYVEPTENLYRAIHCVMGSIRHRSFSIKITLFHVRLFS